GKPKPGILVWQIDPTKGCSADLRHCASLSHHVQLASGCYIGTLSTMAYSQHNLTKTALSVQATLQAGRFTLTLSGTGKPGLLTVLVSSGSGTWNATGIPARCRKAGNRNGQATGTYTVKGSADPQGTAPRPTRL